jgi:SnoaL-like domain
MDPAVQQAITECADRAAIENVLGLYCRAIDRLDLELLKSVYHPDGADDHGAISANAHEFADQVLAMLKDACVYTMHTVTHSVIDLHGEKASSESYYIAVHLVAAGERCIGNFFGPTYLDEQRAAGRLDRRHEFLCCGRYLDQLHKRDGRWRIYRRKMTNEWGVCRPESTVNEGVPGAFTVTGNRDRKDPVYGLMLG